MYIVNKHGFIHTVEDGATLPTDAREATVAEAAYYESPNSDCVAENVPLIPKPAENKKAAK